MEISSDEEEDWISELLDNVDRDPDYLDDDVVVVVGEVSHSSSTIQKQKITPSREAVKGTGADSDDDCLVLDGDPDKPVDFVDDDGNGADDLLIVGEKGQLACRDYPHSRHLCAKFPFSSTPHDKHCDLCHCYVCDSRAPCIYWGTGVSSTDHCHSTDKEEMWRIKRKCFKQGNIAAPPSQEILDTSLSMMPSCISAPKLHSNRSRRVGSHSLQSSVSKSTHMHACSTSFGTPNIIRRNQRLLPIPRVSRAHLYVNRSKQLAQVSNMLRSGGSTVGCQLGASHPKFKRSGSSQSSFTIVNQSINASCNNPQMHALNQPRIRSPQVILGEDIGNRRWQDLLAAIDSAELDALPDSSHSNDSSVFPNFQEHAQFQPYDQSLPNMNQKTHQSWNHTPNTTNPDLSADFNWFNTTSNSTPQQLLAADPIVRNGQPSEPLVFSQQESAFLESLAYSLDHQSVPGIATDPLLSDLDPATIVHELEGTWPGLHQL